MKRIGLSLLLVTLSGCIAPQNDRLTEGHGPAAVKFEAFSRDSGRAANPVASDGGSGGQGGRIASSPPTLTGLDRSNWDRTVVAVPVDGTAHHPTYVQRLIVTDSTARQRQEYPTAESALELTQGSGETQAWEAPLQSVQAFRDLLLGPFRLIGQPPWRVRWSPDESYARVWYTAPRVPAPKPTSEQSDQDKAFAEPKPVHLTP